jgi:SRSO17 transposase
LDQHHYLGAPALVGASLKYLVYSAQDQLVGALGWQSVVERLGCRDRLMDWKGRQQSKFRDHGVNNVRFLIMPWVEVRHLASAMLSQGVKVLQRDWPRRYGKPVWWVESFVDPQRFSGACYRAANWVGIGWTRGFAKQQGQFVHHGHVKEVYVYVLKRSLRRVVHGQAAQPLLTRSFLLAHRLREATQTLAKRTRMQEAKASWSPQLPPELNLSPEDLARIGEELSEFSALFRPTFRRIEPFELYELYLQGLLSSTQRKNVEAIALELLGPQAVRNLQRLLSEYKWDESWLKQRHWELSAQALSQADGVWSLDASEIPKKGQESVGVAPQYCGVQGKTANCQSGVFICYTSSRGHALLDARLYLPQCWFEKEYEGRYRKCRIPPEVDFQTKPQLAQELLEGLVESKLFAAQWVTMDTVFGNNEAFLDQLPQELLYLAEIPCTRKVWPQTVPGHPHLESVGCTVEQLMAEPDLLPWFSRKLAEGQKGPMVADFAKLRVYLSPQRTPESERTLVLRNDASGKIKYALSNAPETTPLEEFIRVSGARWPIERCFQEDKSQLGLDHYEHRSWPAWHRHMRLVFLAQLFLLRLRLKYKKSPGSDVAPSPSSTGMRFAPSQTDGQLSSAVS